MLRLLPLTDWAIPGNGAEKGHFEGRLPSPPIPRRYA